MERGCRHRSTVVDTQKHVVVAQSPGLAAPGVIHPRRSQLQVRRQLARRERHVSDLADTIALSQNARLSLVEVFHGDLYLISVNNDRVTLLDKVTNTEVVEKVRYPRGRPAQMASGS